MFRRWAVAWLGGSVLGIGNGVFRETVIADRVDELTANQISGATLVALLAFYVWVVERRWPIPSTRAALEIGAMWGVLTVFFEFGFGHWVDRKSWAELLENYDVTAGRLWVFVLAWLVVAPAVVRALRRARLGFR